MKIMGEIPEFLRGLIIDIDGTVYEKEGPFLKQRTMEEYQWLSRQLGITTSRTKEVIAQRKKELKQRNQNRNTRISLSEAVFSFGLTSNQWNTAREQTLPNPADFLEFNPLLQKRLMALLKRDVLIVWATNSPMRVGESILKTVLGTTIVDNTTVVGQDKEISKPNPDYFKKLVIPIFAEKGISVCDIGSIGDKEDDDGKAPIAAGISVAIIVRGPKELQESLNKIVKFSPCLSEYPLE